MSKIRKAAVEGLFYSSNAEILRNEIEFFLDKAKDSLSVRSAAAVVAPHAGYKYSGAIAAHAYNQFVDKNIETIIILSPSHREYFNGTCIYDGGGYATPLGVVEINRELSDKIIDCSEGTIFYGEAGHIKEHAIEVHLPFLQVALDNIKIVPIVMGEQSVDTIEKLAECLAHFIDNKTVLLVSSDLSHFYSKSDAYKIDSILANHILNTDYKGLQRDLELKRCEACGGGGIVAMLKIGKLLDKGKTQILKRGDSGDVTYDNSEVVGYLSAVMY